MPGLGPRVWRRPGRQTAKTAGVSFMTMSTSTRPELLFSYGTLQYKKVQIANFGRELTGREDALPGYTRGRVPISEPEVVASSGESYYANAVPSSNPEDAVSGTVFEVTEEDLAAADR